MKQTKRSLFDDLMGEVTPMGAHREGKLTLRTHRLDRSIYPQCLA